MTSAEATLAAPPVSPRVAAARRRQRIAALALGFIAMVLLVDGIVGERGLLEMLRARRQHRDVADAIAARGGRTCGSGQRPGACAKIRSGLRSSPAASWD